MSQHTSPSLGSLERPHRAARWSRDRWFFGALTLCAIVAGSLILGITGFVFWEAWPALQEISLTRFFSDPGWYPTVGEFNLAPILLGTLLTTLGAIVLAGPLGIASAVFVQFYAPACWATVQRRVIELLAGIPSVVYGLWGLVVLVPLLSAWGGSGQSLLAASLILAAMILPTVAVTADAAIQSVPAATLRGAAALGLGRWSTAWRVALPACRRAILSGLTLAIGRALGETVAVLLVAGNVVQVPASIADPVRTLTANIALEMGYATVDHRSVLFVSGLTLMATVFLLLTLAEWGRGKHEHA